MAITLANVSKGHDMEPPRLMIYGTPGIGKTSFGASAPSPIFIAAEDGIPKKFKHIDRFPPPSSYTEVEESINALIKEEHQFSTLVIDTMDWVERLLIKLHQEIYTQSDLGYGKDQVLQRNHWLQFTQKLSELRAKKNMAIILLAHSIVKKYDDPQSDGYDRHVPNIGEKNAASLLQWVDLVGFAKRDVVVQKPDNSPNSKGKGVDVANGRRILCTEERAAFVAKNRYDLPPEIPFSWEHFMNAVKGEPKND